MHGQYAFDQWLYLLINDLGYLQAIDNLLKSKFALMHLCSSFPSEMSERDHGKNEMYRLLTLPTTTQAGGEKRIEYCQLKVATLAEEGQ